MPSFLASYLVNGDDSGLEGSDQYEADKFLAERNLPMPVSCGESYIGTWNGQMCDMADYAFLLQPVGLAASLAQISANLS